LLLLALLTEVVYVQQKLIASILSWLVAFGYDHFRAKPQDILPLYSYYLK